MIAEAVEGFAGDPARFNQFRKSYYELINANVTNYPLIYQIQQLMIEGLKLAIEIFSGCLNEPTKPDPKVKEFYRKNLLSTFSNLVGVQRPDLTSVLTSLFNFNAADDKFSYFLKKSDTNSLSQIFRSFYRKPATDKPENSNSDKERKLRVSKMDLLSDPTNTTNRNVY
jgi:hypothetical protein